MSNSKIIIRKHYKNIDTDDFAIFHCYLINLVREIVEIIASVQCWSNVGISTPTFPLKKCCRLYNQIHIPNQSKRITSTNGSLL